jgi:glutamate dehydrogenase
MDQVNTPVRRPADAMAGIIDQVVEHALALAIPLHLPVDVAAFTRHYYRNAAADDLRETSPRQLAGAVVSHLQFMQVRTPGRPKFRVFMPDRDRDGWSSPYLVLELVGDDMPFLVSTTALALQNTHLNVRMTIHPVYAVERNASGHLLALAGTDDEAMAGAPRESLVHLQFERDVEQAQLVLLMLNLSEGLTDLRFSIEDWRPMREALAAAREELADSAPPVPDQQLEESLAFLQWMTRRNFTFLGYRRYSLEVLDGAETLVPICDTGIGILRPDSRLSRRPPEFARVLRHHLRGREPLIITKADTVSTIHRFGRLDYIGIKQYDATGSVIGEHRFIGLFTASVYYTDALAIPLVRLKIEQILQREGLTRASHAGRILLHVLQTHPRDELLQASVEDLARITGSIRALQDRRLTRLYIRRDLFRRFIACLVYVPRDKFNTRLRERIEAMLLDALGGDSLESEVTLSDATLARVYTVVRIDPTHEQRIGLRHLQERIADAVQTWDDRLRDVLVGRHGEAPGITLARRFGSSFSAAYCEDSSPETAADDIERILALDADDERSLDINLYRPSGAPRERLHLKLIRYASPIALSTVLPALENLGLEVISERPYQVTNETGPRLWIQDFEMHLDQAPEQVADVQKIFRQAAEAVWLGWAENDGFNALVLSARMGWRDVMLLRALCRYLLQTGLPFSQAYMEQVLQAHTDIAATLVSLFHCRLDPDARDDEHADQLAAGIEDALNDVASADDDRILRAFLAVAVAVLRTNFFQRRPNGTPLPYLSLKLDPQRIPGLPEPRPMFEIFVYSPQVEGVHLRTARVARGGLRWSDRREDFRTEILGLMKAQKVKNTVIVPTGAKGGFVAKSLPDGDRDAIMAEGIACYRTFIRGLLDLTDNIVDGDIVAPPRTVCRDDPDTYLVVAADKGTASFSDIANEEAAAYGFWLGDAFASGGSVGYDHKKMGITAKGAWEAVKRHFRELAVDIQREDFTVAGIGDMSGDVFGNGMLLSKHIRLVAAFNHQHIFIDPDPDTARSYDERQRLFGLPRSSWADYDQSLISAGGGVFARTSKSIHLSQQARTLLDLDRTNLTPDALISAILRMRVDLLWNGGIGTYVKAIDEGHEDAGDRANDAVRINARELRCRVIGEGGNLGLTQRARIEFAQHGGAINTDFIDNAGGVDCSDHEVNIKILLDLLVKRGELDGAGRNTLLADMTEAVSNLVLRSNYLQTQAISFAAMDAAARFREHLHLMRSLERERELSRQLEALPDEEEANLRNKAGRGLSRPEISVLVSYAKMHLYRQLIESDAPEDPDLAETLHSYFPAPLRALGADAIGDHPLAREIISTQVTNSIVNRMGPTFAHRAMEDMGADAGAIAQAYTTAVVTLRLRELWAGIERLDNKVPAATQHAMLHQIARVLRQTTYWLLAQLPRGFRIGAVLKRYSASVDTIRTALPQTLSATEREAFMQVSQDYEDAGVPATTAQRMAELGPLTCAFDVVDIAAEFALDLEQTAHLYFRVGGLVGADWLREQIELLEIRGRWQAIARQGLRDNAYALQREVTRLVVRGCSNGNSAACDATVSRWAETNAPAIARLGQIIQDIREVSQPDFESLTVVAQELRKLTRAAPPA